MDEVGWKRGELMAGWVFLIRRSIPGVKATAYAARAATEIVRNMMRMFDRKFVRLEVCGRPISATRRREWASKGENPHVDTW
jgi:hypothetical protein